MRLKKCNRKQFYYIWLTFTLLLILYIEFFSYWTNTSSWLIPKCENPQNCLKILLVADPQIIGERKELLHYITPFSIVDSDLYLRKTYFWAFKYTQPDVVIFLGDLMDEGSIAKDDEFISYVRRIYRIFMEKSSTPHIWLPGDNDVGGEEFEHVTKEKIKRFYRAFPQPELMVVKNVTFFKINRLIQSIPVYKKQRDFYDSSRIFVGMSHLPLMFLPSPFVEKVFKKMSPHVLFTAHEHKSMIISTDALLRQDLQVIPIRPDNTQIFEYTLAHSNMYEFIIPTCSYRMGTDKIGYGFAVLEQNEIRFSILWSPSRFLQLKYYFIFISFSLVVFLIRFCFNLGRKI